MNIILPKILFAIYDHDVESFSKLFYIKIQVNLLEPSITDLLPLWQKHNEEVTEMRNKRSAFENNQGIKETFNCCHFTAENNEWVVKEQTWNFIY